MAARARATAIATSEPLPARRDLPGCAPFHYKAPTMASPQDSPTRKKQKIRAARKLAKWREQRDSEKTASPAEAAKK